MSAERYSRQMVLPAVGPDGQAKLAAARVLVVGAGGLGAPVLAYLGGAGIGRLVIVDPDVVELGNLHRQPLFTMADLGRSKAEAARAAVLARNPALEVEALAVALTPANAAGLITACDVVVDAADSFAVTYALSDAALRIGRPLVSASVLGQQGYVGCFCGAAPSYRAVFPGPPAQAATCATAGVLGSAVAVLGGLQAQMVLALLLGQEPSPAGRVTTVDLVRFGFGGFDFHGAPEPEQTPIPFLAPEEVGRDDLVIDVRGLDEAPVSPIATALRLGVEAAGQFEDAGDRRIVLCCRSGLRAWRAAAALQARGFNDLALVAFGP